MDGKSSFSLRFVGRYEVIGLTSLSLDSTIINGMMP
jgi:hypothetical protein